MRLGTTTPSPACYKRFNGAVKHQRQAVQDANRDIAIPGFKLRQIAFGHAGYITQHTS